MSRKEPELMRDIKRRWAIKCELGELYCFLCNKKIESMKDCNADHWVPRSLGGKSTEENLKPSHVKCNSLKGSIPPEEFVLHRDEILRGNYHQPIEYTEKQIKPTKEKKQKAKPGLGDEIWFIQKHNTEISSKVIMKKGIVIGYEDDKVLVKNFYKDINGKFQSELVIVIPLTKKHAENLIKQCNNKTNLILRKQFEKLR